MRTPFVLAALLAVTNCSTVPDADQGQATFSPEIRFALDQIRREINAGKTPVGVLDSAPLSADNALEGLLAMSLKGTTDAAPAVIEDGGYLFCCWQPLEEPYWGQRGYAVKQQTGEVYEWSLW